MADIVHQSQITITRQSGPTRKAIIRAPADQHAAARAALDTYLTRCPGAQRVIGCIDIRHELVLGEPPA
jgi:hypothetical protein